MKIVVVIKKSFSNHGSFYYNQEAAIRLILDDKDGAKAVLQEYFEGIFQEQIAASGEQVSLGLPRYCEFHA